jgi:putative acetyltransferase
MTGGPTIRREVPDDYTAIREVHVAAFGQDNEARLVEELRACSGFDGRLSLVAERDGRVIGHVLFSPITIRGECGAIAALVLAPLAVLPAHQNSGVGSRLVRRGLKACRGLGHGLVIVVGHPDFYRRFGFRRARSRGLTLPFDAPDDAFLLWEATPDEPRDIAGTVEFPPAFDNV